MSEYTGKLHPDPTKVVDNCIKELLSATATVEGKIDSSGRFQVYAEMDAMVVARKQLVIDGYMVEHAPKSGYFYLTGLGRRFLTIGGYQNLFNEQEAAKKLNNQQMESVIKTNKYTVWNIAVTILFALIVTGIQITTIMRDINKDNHQTQKETTGLPKQKEPEKSDSPSPAKAGQLVEGMKDSLKKGVSITTGK